MLSCAQALYIKRPCILRPPTPRVPGTRFGLVTGSNAAINCWLANGLLDLYSSNARLLDDLLVYVPLAPLDGVIWKGARPCGFKRPAVSYMDPGLLTL